MDYFQWISTIFQAFVLHLYLRCTHCIVSESLLNHWNNFHGGMFKLNTKCDADLLLQSLSHFEYNSHKVHMLIQQHLPPPLTSTVKLPFIVHACTVSPFSSAAFLHRCHANHFPYINNGGTFSRQTSYTITKWHLSLECKDVSTYTN